MGRRRATWSSNEYFAHKKNVGEEVKLKYNIVTIERHYGLVKDAMKFKVNEERTSLKSLRKSTGHSIEALPPTPFQSHTRETTIEPLPAIKPSSSSEIPSEYRYLENGIDHEHNNVLVEILGDGNDDEENDQNDQATMHEKYQGEGQRNIPNLVPDQALCCKNKETLSHGDKGHVALPSLNTDNKTFLSSETIGLIKENGSKNQENDCSGFKVMLPSTDSDSFTAKQSDEMDRFPGNESMSLRNGDSFLKAESVSNSEFKENSPNHHPKCNALASMDLIIPKSPCSTISPRLETVSTRSRVDPSEIKHSCCEPILPSIESESHQRGENAKTAGKSNAQGLLQKRKEMQEKQRHSQALMRDIRTRCRTCVERFRQNLEFQRRKKEKEQQERIQRQNEMEKRFLPKDKPFILSADDLESLMSDEVLDFDDYRERHSKLNKANRCKKGYSRKRMDELSQPRAGRRRKLLFSKHLIRKEADILIESHSQPELTEREKERVRMLESKIRMFLAMMQGSLVPSKMVDIPQREDIMKVDISHL